MAVQAQYPSNILLLNNRNVQEGKNNLLGNNDFSLQPQQSGGFLDQSQFLINNNNEVGGGGEVNPRKRNREVATTPNTTAHNMNINSFGFSLQNHHQHHQQQQQNHNQSHQLIDLSQLHHQPNVVSTGLRLSFGDQNQQHLHQHQQHHQQQQEVLQQQSSSLLSLFSEDFSLQLKQQSDELNYFLHTQGEQLRRTLAEKRQRHYRALLGVAEDALARRVREKEVEVEKAARRNAELEARAAQLTAEAQAWQAKARAQEAQAASLQAQIHQAININNNNNNNNGSGAQQQERERSGLGCAEAEDSESAYVDPVSDRRVNSPSCRICRSRAACVVVLPCRHMCVCVECDGVVQACPVCLIQRSASLQVYLS